MTLPNYIYDTASMKTIIISGDFFIVRVDLPEMIPVTGHKGPWRGALLFSLICAWTNGWANNRGARELRRHCADCRGRQQCINSLIDTFTQEKSCIIHTWKDDNCNSIRRIVQPDFRLMPPLLPLMNNFWPINKGVQITIWSYSIHMTKLVLLLDCFLPDRVSD